MSRRRALLGSAACCGWLAAWHAVAAPAARRRLGVLLYDGPENWQFLRDELSPALLKLGWQEGANLVSDWRFARGDAARLAGLAQALLRDGADVLLTRGTPATRALQQATRTVPIVTGVGDPIGAGFAASLAAPGSNITGLSYAIAETSQKQIELLREIAPLATRLLVLVPADRSPVLAEVIAVVERNARAQRLEPQILRAGDAQALRQRLGEARGKGDAAAFVFAFGSLIPPRNLASALLQAGVAAVFDQRGYVDAGGLMSYRLDWDDQTQRIAAQLDKVLRGVPPAQLPFELPTRSALVLNAGTAKALGLKIPIALRMRADEVIQ